ncbi:MAG: PKD domain-containing protein [Candidatus Pacearchaeota archaeon]|nr:PKD domain-containing protein [Candidatus Pacearchaeota archaeon]
MAGGTIGCSGSCSGPAPSESLCNSAPTASNLQPTQGNNCGVSSPPVILSWTFSDPNGNGQSAYQAKVYQGGVLAHDSGKVSSSSQQYAAPLGVLVYNTSYTWTLQVWDNYSIPAASGVLSGPIFTTPAHRYPSPDFTWSPITPGENELASFTDTSSSYGGSSLTAWSWVFQNGTPAGSTAQNPSASFSPIGQKSVTLQATDSSGFSCTTSPPKTVNIGVPFPEWEEISPFGFDLLFPLVLR